VRKEYREVNRLRKGYERNLNFRLIRTFSQIGSDASNSYINGGLQGFEVYSRRILPNIQSVLEPFYMDCIKTFAQRMFTQRMAQKATQDYDLIYSQYMKTLGGVRIVGISETTREIIANTILANRDEGVGSIANAINERMSPRFTRARANTIARTETHTVSSFAIHAQARNFEEPSMQKRWVSSNDPRTRSTHNQANGQTVSIDDPFIVGGKEMQYAGDPKGGASEVINCRCVVVYIEPEDFVVDENTAQKPIPEPVNPFGQTNKDELLFQENADWNRSSTPFKTIKYIQPIKVKYGVGRAYADRNEIGMGARSASQSDILEHMEVGNRKTTWRHEVGHVMDTDNTTDILNIMKNKEIYSSMPVKYRFTDYISGFLAKDVLKDRKFQKKFSKEDIGKNVNKDMSKFGLTGVKRDKNGKLEFVSTGQLRKADYDMETKEIINKEFKGTGLDFDDLNELADGQLLNQMQLGQMKQIKLKRMAIYSRNNDVKSFLIEQRGARIFNDDMLYFSDYLEAISNAKIGFGHGKGYYGQFYKIERGVSIGHTTEAMANYTALIGGKRAKVFKKLMEIYAPNMTKSFDELFELYQRNDLDGMADLLRRKVDGD